MHSHISAVSNARVEYLLDISYVKCLRMFQDGILAVGNSGIIDGLKSNTSDSRSVMLAGSIKNERSCQGTQSDPYGTWDNVIVDAIVRINLKSSYVPVHLNTNRIMLKSGTVCDLNDDFCIDYDSHTFWKPMPISSCNFHRCSI